MSNYRPSPFANLTPVVKNLLIINVICYLAIRVLPYAHFDFIGIMAAHYFYSPDFRPWQIITYMFMHDPKSVLHILFNMFALFIFGPTLEMTMGSKRFFNFYFITGIGALLTDAAMRAIQIYSITHSFNISDINAFAGSPDFSRLQEAFYGSIVGASGAIFGLLVAFGMLFPDVELMIMFIPIPIKAKYVVIGYIVIELFSGFGQFSGDSVAHFAHLGGALFGFIMIRIWGLHRHDNYY